MIITFFQAGEGGRHFDIASDIGCAADKGPIFLPKTCKGCLFSLKSLHEGVIFRLSRSQTYIKSYS